MRVTEGKRVTLREAGAHTLAVGHRAEEAERTAAARDEAVLSTPSDSDALPAPPKQTTDSKEGSAMKRKQEVIGAILFVVCPVMAFICLPFFLGQETSSAPRETFRVVSREYVSVGSTREALVYTLEDLRPATATWW